MEKGVFSEPPSRDHTRDNTTQGLRTVHIAVGVDENGGFFGFGGSSGHRVPLRPDVAVMVRVLMESGGSPDLLDCLMEALSTPPQVDEEAIKSALVPFRWMLDRARESLSLTAAGYLKPADVLALSEILPTAQYWIGKRNREDQTMPVWDFRTMMMRCRLLRKYKGQLLLTSNGKRALGDPIWLWQWLGWQVLEVDRGRVDADAAMIDLIFAAANHRADRALSAVILNQLGWHLPGDDPIDEWTVYGLADTWRMVVACLDSPTLPRGRPQPVPPIERAFALNALTMQKAPVISSR